METHICSNSIFSIIPTKALLMYPLKFRGGPSLLFPYGMFSSNWRFTQYQKPKVTKELFKKYFKNKCISCCQRVDEQLQMKQGHSSAEPRTKVYVSQQTAMSECFSKPLDQLCQMQLSAMMEMFSICTIGYGSHYPHVAIKHLNQGKES